MIYITGDTHGCFERIERFCRGQKTSREDILIILGDAGINYVSREHDREKKRYLESLPITLFCIHGNHERSPCTIDSYQKKIWHGGTVYFEEEYPDLLFAKDGGIFELNGKKTIVIGGAYSIDKMIRIRCHYGWWPDEQPSDEIRKYVEQQLEKAGWCVDAVLSHTAPLKYEPVEFFLTGVAQSLVDKSTETWLDGLEDRMQYEKWYCGHYHAEKETDRIKIMFENYAVFCGENLQIKALADG